MVEHKVSSTSDFEWFAQLRYYYRATNKPTSDEKAAKSKVAKTTIHPQALLSHHHWLPPLCMNDTHYS